MLYSPCGALELTFVQGNGEEPPQLITSESEEEQIYVTRHEEELDPEAEADFDQAFEKLMAESLDSRKFERRALFDVPLPMRRGQRETGLIPEEAVESGAQTPPHTMSFALMTKKGNRQQVRLYWEGVQIRSFLLLGDADS